MGPTDVAMPELRGLTGRGLIAAGRYADVFRYDDLRTGCPLAVKVLHDARAPFAIARAFRAEVAMLKRMRGHDSVVRLRNAGVNAEGRRFLAMEYCPSTVWPAGRIPLAVDEVLQIGVRIASALDSLHRMRALHRDIKPSNILVTAEGHAVLADFGAVAIGQRRGLEMTWMSVPWCAPEVLRRDVAGSVAAEVWSFSATLYTLLAGRAPFEDRRRELNRADLVVQRVAQDTCPPIDRSDIPSDFEVLIGEGLRKRPEARPPSIAVVLDALRRVQDNRAVP